MELNGIEPSASTNRRSTKSPDVFLPRDKQVAVADPRKIALNVVMVVARLYGFDEGRKLAERWGVPVPRKS